LAEADDAGDAAVDDAAADGPPTGVDTDGDDALPHAARSKQIDIIGSSERRDIGDTSSRRTLAAGRHRAVSLLRR